MFAITYSIMFVDGFVIRTIKANMDGIQKNSDGQVAVNTHLTACSMVGFDVQMHIGTSRQKVYNMLVDTGSTTMAVATTLCDDSCYALNPQFNPSQEGGTLIQASPKVTLTYGDGSSIRGPVYQALASLVDDNSILSRNYSTANVQFVAVDHNSDFFSTADCFFNPEGNVFQGLLGLGFAQLAFAPIKSGYMDQLVLANSNTMLNQFTIQLCDIGGNLWFGEYDGRFMKSKLQNIQMMEPFDFYRVHIAAIQFNRSSVIYQAASATSNMKAIVDSGTTQILLPQATFDLIINRIYDSPYFQQAFNNDRNFFRGGVCHSTTNSATMNLLNQNLPSWSLALARNTSTIQDPLILELLPVSSYLLPFHYQSNTPEAEILYCPGIGAYSGEFAILGFAFMNQYTINFNREAFSLGFAPTNLCGVESTPFPFYVAENWTDCASYTCSDLTSSSTEGGSFTQTSIGAQCTFMNGSVSTNPARDCPNQSSTLVRQCPTLNCVNSGNSSNLLIYLLTGIIGGLVGILLLIAIVRYCCLYSRSKSRPNGARNRPLHHQNRV
jgi:hypothetical protein